MRHFYFCHGVGDTSVDRRDYYMPSSIKPRGNVAARPTALDSMSELASTYVSCTSAFRRIRSRPKPLIGCRRMRFHYLP